MARQPFNQRWAEGVETEDNPNSFQAPETIRIDTGWEGGQSKDAPRAGQENWWHNRVDTALQDLERRGVMAYHPLAIYMAGAPCYTPDGLYYESVANNNTGNEPGSSPTFWRLIGTSLYSSFPVGCYLDVSHNGSPDPGWLKSVGSVLLIAAYPKLYAKIGKTYNTGGESSLEFRIPDWRGLFPRCLDDGRGIDTGRVLNNTPQPSQNLAHSHSGSTSTAGSHRHDVPLNYDRGPAGAGNLLYGDEPYYGSGRIPTDSAGAHSHSLSISSSGGTEARPIGGAQVRWIRYL